MPTIVRKSNPGATASGTSIAPAFSSGSATAGNLLVVCADTAGFPSTNALNTPTGYTLVTPPGVSSFWDNKQLALFIKEAAGGETGVTVTKEGASQRMTGYIFEVSGADAAALVADPSLLVGNDAETGSTVTSLASASINPPSTGEVLFLLYQVVSTDPGAVSGWTSGFATEQAQPSGGRGFVGSKTDTNPDATTTTPTWTNGGNASSIIIGIPAAEEEDPPVANAGADDSYQRTATIVLDGSGTTGATSYAWVQVSGPAVATIADSSAASTTASTTVAGTYVFELEATNASGTTSDTVTASVPADFKMWNGEAWI